MRQMADARCENKLRVKKVSCCKRQLARTDSPAMQCAPVFSQDPVVHQASAPQSRRHRSEWTRTPLFPWRSECMNGCAREAAPGAAYVGAQGTVNSVVDPVVQRSRCIRAGMPFRAAVAGTPPRTVRAVLPGAGPVQHEFRLSPWCGDRLRGRRGGRTRGYITGPPRGFAVLNGLPLPQVSEGS